MATEKMKETLKTMGWAGIAGAVWLTILFAVFWSGIWNPNQLSIALYGFATGALVQGTVRVFKIS